VVPLDDSTFSRLGATGSEDMWSHKMLPMQLFNMDEFFKFKGLSSTKTDQRIHPNYLEN